MPTCSPLGGEAKWRCLRGVQSGDLAIRAVGDYVREATVFLLPLLFGGTPDARAALDGPIGQEILSKLPAHGLVGLARTEGGLPYIAKSKSPIQSPSTSRT
jgi:TRAP-type C4-dicarboxylate transport system substrate-binding protein